MEPGTFDVTLEPDVEMRTRDGVLLRSDVYRPSGDGPFPVLLRRTPYGKRLNDLAMSVNEARQFAAHGYLVVVQDTRGRFASEGEFVPFFDEGADGYDAVEWAAGLPGANGDVGTFGQSYGALCQYLTLPLRPPHLRTAIPVSAPVSMLHNCIYRDGPFELNWMLGYLISMAKDDAMRRERPDLIEILDGYLVDRTLRFSPVTDAELRHLPLAHWGHRLADAAPHLAGYLAHPSDDGFWDPLDVAARAAEIAIPVLHVGSWYDGFQYDTLALYGATVASGRTDQSLLMGPWAHLLPYSVPTSKGTGDIDFGPAAAIDLLGIEKRWFDAHLKAGPPASAPVRLFVMGPNEWRDEPAWPLARAVEAVWHLRSGGGLGVDAPGPDDPPSSFRYDPDDPVPTLGGHFVGPDAGVADQRAVEDRADVLVFTGPPLDAPVEITGNVQMHLWVRSSAPETDFVATLVDVRPDGYAHNLLEGVVRARLDRDSPTLLTIDLWSTCHVLRAGHRLRVDITSSSFPRWDRNPNTGDPFGTATTVTVAEQTILHDRQHASCVVLPVVDWDEVAGDS